MEQTVTLRIILLQPPTGVGYGLQKGKGPVYETIQQQRATGNDLHFEGAITVKKSKTGEPDFFGPLVQGPVNERFIYIGIGSYAGEQHSIWNRRLKVPLRDITAAMIEQLATNPTAVLETRVQGTAKDGSPTCATVKPFDGWKVLIKPGSA
jgi:hypothetical protein